MAERQYQLVNFEDLSIQVPSYLRAKSKFIFHGPSRPSPERELMLVSISPLRDAVSIDATRQAMLHGPETLEWMGMKQTALRRGRAKWALDSAEVLIEMNNLAMDQVHYDYSILLERESLTVQIRILGGGTLEIFEQLIRSIILSVADKADR